MLIVYGTFYKFNESSPSWAATKDVASWIAANITSVSDSGDWGQLKSHVYSKTDLALVATGVHKSFSDNSEHITIHLVHFPQKKPLKCYTMHARVKVLTGSIGTKDFGKPTGLNGFSTCTPYGTAKAVSNTLPKYKGLYDTFVAYKGLARKVSGLKYDHSQDKFYRPKKKVKKGSKNK